MTMPMLRNSALVIPAYLYVGYGFLISDANKTMNRWR